MQAINPKQAQTIRTRRAAFTLVEILVVIAVISILLALLLPALSGVLGRGREVEVGAEMSQLDQALTAFKSRFGEFPPSSLSIPSEADADDLANWDPRSVAAIKSIWPQFNFRTRGGLNNADTPPPALELNGAECLVFFLGGGDADGEPANGYAPGGFSKNPLEPWVASGNPDGPFFNEFDLSRMVDVDGDNLFEYLDALPDQTAPLLYISTGSNGRYNKSADAGVFDDYDVYGEGDARNLSSVYTQADGSTAWKQDSFQLISAGEDGLYGTGGTYVVDEDFDSSRLAEADNITNFSDGTLN